MVIDAMEKTTASIIPRIVATKGEMSFNDLVMTAFIFGMGQAANILVKNEGIMTPQALSAAIGDVITNGARQEEDPLTNQPV